MKLLLALSILITTTTWAGEGGGTNVGGGGESVPGSGGEALRDLVDGTACTWQRANAALGRYPGYETWLTDIEERYPLLSDAVKAEAERLVYCLAPGSLPSAVVRRRERVFLSTARFAAEGPRQQGRLLLEAIIRGFVSSESATGRNITDRLAATLTALDRLVRDRIHVPEFIRILRENDVILPAAAAASSAAESVGSSPESLTDFVGGVACTWETSVQFLRRIPGYARLLRSLESRYWYFARAIQLEAERLSYCVASATIAAAADGEKLFLSPRGRGVAIRRGDRVFVSLNELPTLTAPQAAFLPPHVGTQHYIGDDIHQGAHLQATVDGLRALVTGAGTLPAFLRVLEQANSTFPRLGAEWLQAHRSTVEPLLAGGAALENYRRRRSFVGTQPWMGFVEAELLPQDAARLDRYGDTLGEYLWIGGLVRHAYSSPRAFRAVAQRADFCSSVWPTVVANSEALINLGQDPLDIYVTGSTVRVHTGAASEREAQRAQMRNAIMSGRRSFLWNAVLAFDEEFVRTVPCASGVIEYIVQTLDSGGYNWNQRLTGLATYPDAVTSAGTYGYTPLLFAARTRRASWVRELLQIPGIQREVNFGGPLETVGCGAYVSDRRRSSPSHSMGSLREMVSLDGYLPYVRPCDLSGGASIYMGAGADPSEASAWFAERTESRWDAWGAATLAVLNDAIGH